MASRDMKNEFTPVVALAPVVVTDGTAQTSLVVDTLGYESATFVIALGTLADTDATWSVTVYEGDTATQGEHTAVADIDLIGTEADAGFTFADDLSCKKIGYKGSKRYLSLVIDDVVANTGNAPMSVVALLGNPRHHPAA